MNWHGKKVLVTGAGGFIGSHLTERLVELGADVRALVHYNSGGRRGWLDESPLQDQMTVLAGDITDAGSVREAMKDREVVFHLAALIAIPYSYVAPNSYVQTNVVGTVNVLEAARQLNTERIVHTSTSEVYGSALQVPISEDHPLQGQSPYSASKIGADKLVESYYNSFELPVTTVRPFNTFGPRQSARAVLPTIITQCLTGDSVRLGSLTPTRDLNYVANTVHGFISAAASPAAIGRTMNVGSGQEISIGDLAHLIAELVGKPITIESDEQRHRPEKSEVQRLLADNRLAKELIDWEPIVDFRTGLSNTIDWFRENLAGYRPDVYNV
ncbi:UDP-glucose 4-epimerase [Roseimaritima multifibrata]|uniref:UDP-glucose 4-epimerase n=1 Tax=Roseimaritima multifibrata TaxID=1930274 RepID=A0A517MLP3_9BACT|nr:GDP-mannose 4,6-dehydratase [Roseimaritima multifibrata]QDS95825.1 UDP-glucose 4-epimerase [Roseimaritima multifibrata]